MGEETGKWSRKYTHSKTKTVSLGRMEKSITPLWPQALPQKGQTQGEGTQETARTRELTARTRCFLEVVSRESSLSPGRKDRAAPAADPCWGGRPVPWGCGGHHKYIPAPVVVTCPTPQWQVHCAGHNYHKRTQNLERLGLGPSPTLEPSLLLMCSPGGRC